jgi:signal transduction histidine kinase
VLLAGVALVVLGLAVIAVLGVYGFLSGRSVLWPLVRLRRLIAVVVPLSIVAVAALGGVVLIADDLRARFELAQRGLTPWQRLAGTAEVPAPAPWRALGGLALIGLAAVLGLGLIGYHDGHRLVTLALVLVPVAGAMVLIAVPLVIASLARSDRASVTAAREEERLRVAAHLHDSVLQTLALVQRQAHDPVAVARLARRQEHELRAWMAGEVELGSETLGAALREAVAEVEDEHQTVVELTILGDRSLDRGTEALAGAAREALRNAARHAPGAPIFVFAQASPDGAEVFVRDEGPGFELAGVPTERRGVRDSIVGRMTAVGGSAAVESHPGEGTEIALRIGVLT